MTSCNLISTVQKLEEIWTYWKVTMGLTKIPDHKIQKQQYI